MSSTFDFYGAFKISPKLNKKQVKILESLLYKDQSDIPEWVDDIVAENIEYAPLETDGEYIVWNGEQCHADMEDAISYLIDAMRNKVPGFELNGAMICQGYTCMRWHIMCNKGGVWIEEVEMPTGMPESFVIQKVYENINGVGANHES